MSEQPEALRIAYCFEGFAIDHTPNGWPAIRQQQLNEAAAELRRLHEVNRELLEALKLADALLWGANMNAVVVERKVKAAIAKGEQA